MINISLLLNPCFHDGNGDHEAEHVSTAINDLIDHLDQNVIGGEQKQGFPQKQGGNRKNIDKQEEKENIVDDLQSATNSQEERLEELEALSKYMAEAIKYLLLDKILFLGSKYIRRNSITMEERKILKAMYDVYHNGLKGNGDADFIMKGVDAITPNELKQHDNEDKIKKDDN